ncbi:MAG: hypothetical protein IPK97_08920 [Ahniella sp.]|nr:hypothetical protein [Ahniella sp.]
MTRAGMALAWTMLAASAPLTAAITVDGRTDEPEWRQARHFTDFVSTQPFTGDAAPENLRTEAWLLSTPEGLAVALTARHPQGVVRVDSRVQRDFMDQVDRTNFMIDFDADGKSAYDFTISASNDISDEVITRENQFSKDWDADWQHAAHATEEGYSWEWLIPWSITSMKPPVDGKRTIAVYFDRVIGATGQRFATPKATYTQPRFVSDFTKVEIDAHEQSLLAITPYGVALADLKNADQDFKTGADLFWKPNSNHQFALTLNPDFGQVESDNLVVNFDAIETLFTDKRPFFTDNQSAFEISMPGGNLFYTRRVGGRSDDGAGAADINAAIKANGHIGDVGYAFFGATEDGDAGRDFALARLAHRTEGQTVDLTRIEVDRPFLDRNASVTAVHGVFRPNDEWTLDTALHHAHVDAAGSVQSGIGGGVIADWDLPGPFRQQYFLTYVDREQNLNDLGFQDRNNFRLVEWETGYRQDALPDDSLFASHSWELELVEQQNLDGLKLRGTATVQRYSEMRNGGNVFGFLRWRDDVFDDLSSRGNGAFRLKDGFHGYVETLIARQGDGKVSWYLNTELQQSRVGDGLDWTVTVQPRIYFTDQLDWSLGLYATRQDEWLIWQGGREFGTFQSRRLDLVSNLNWFIDDRQELRVKLQAIGIDADAERALAIGADRNLVASAETIEDFRLRRLGFQMRYRYKLGNLSDVFVVYSRGGSLMDEAPNSDPFDALGAAFDLRDDDQFLVKLAYRFEM